MILAAHLMVVVACRSEEVLFLSRLLLDHPASNSRSSIASHLPPISDFVFLDLTSFHLAIVSGSYQPSNSLMLDFYAYYKQATEGTERGSRPSFWDVINRAKWDAWNRLGDMPKEEAMQRYVDGLNKVTNEVAIRFLSPSTHLLVLVACCEDGDGSIGCENNFP